ncbi:MAG: glycosyltransferase family 4 protein [Lachnospiraceae bacterium]|nr:glycosyltransferase family 4 protein [Lachnospiraceae bacterium]
MKAVVFGAGQFYQKRREELLSYEDVERVAVIDNNVDIQGMDVDGVPVLAVEQITNVEFDVILLMSTKTKEMKEQLSVLGIDSERIWHWQRLKSVRNKGIFRFYCGCVPGGSDRKKVLIISTDLGYNGGTLAAVYAAKALQKRNYHVVLAAPGGNQTFIEEMKNDGLNLVICSAMPYLYQEEKIFAEQFDFVIVNVFQMILCAEEISKRKPVLWWIHEPSHLHAPILEQFSDCAKEVNLTSASIYAVGKIAQKNFNRYFPGRIQKTLAYGIPDERTTKAGGKENSKVVFAVIGGVNRRKAQDIFLKAIGRLEESSKNNAAFWLIGLMEKGDYGNEVRKFAIQESNIKLWGEMTRKEIQNIYREIDVLVCPSLEDPLPIVVTEAMMYGKACIVSDSVGTADYIQDGENGFICKTGDPEHLAEKMRWIIDHRERLKVIGEKARKIYEQHFTMDKFADRLEEALLDAMYGYEARLKKK